MKKIEISPYGNLLVYKKDYTPDIVYKIIQEKNLHGLRIFSVLKEDKLESISFLKNYSFLEQLDITSNSDFDFSFLHYLPNLKKLTLNVGGNSEINLSHQGKLEYLSLLYRSNLKGLENCKNLSGLSLTDFKKDDMILLESFTNLRKLKVTTSAVRSLNGLDKLHELEYLLLGDCKKLISIVSINGLTHLNYLEFNGCPKIREFSSLSDFPNLQTLNLTDCNKVVSLGFIKNFPVLSNLGLLGNTDIVDGDLSAALNIKFVALKNRAHYNPKIMNIESEKIAKGNLEKLKNKLK